MFHNFLGNATIINKNNLQLILCKNRTQQLNDSLLYFDRSQLPPFFEKHPEFNYLKADLLQLYQKSNYKYRWFDKHGISEYGHLLYDKVINMQSEGVAETHYKDKLDSLFQHSKSIKIINAENEIFLSAIYINYMEKVYCGLDISKSTALGWYIPRKNLCVLSRLDSILQKPNLLFEQDYNRIPQYNKLKKSLEKYRAIESNGGWQTIGIPARFKNLKPKDTSEIIIKLKQRFMIVGELQQHEPNNLYDNQLSSVVLNYKKRHGLSNSIVIDKELLSHLNVPISNRIQTILVNMERCRWFSADLLKFDTYIVVNIPSYQLTLYRNGNPDFASRVVVGKSLTQTIIFSGLMSQIVFSPYWNIPSSIVKNEILPELKKNKHYLEQHDMEWNGSNLRQRPGEKNALGLIKFIFPNSNNIYLHDTPSKALFKNDKRAFSHGCIRVEKPKELAIELLKNDRNWNTTKIDLAMKSGIQKVYNLKEKTPVYIGYFTAWVNETDEICFYDDIYSRDIRLYNALTK